MASQQRMFDDPALASHVQGGQAVAENSGEGPSVDSVNAAFMASPSHRDNILGPYSQVGVGVVWTGSTLWVAEVFRQPFPSASPQPAPTTAAPITAPPTTAPPTTTLPVAVRAAARPAQARTRAVVRPAAVTPQVVEPAASPKPPPTTTPPTTSPPPAAALGFALPLPTASPSTVELGSTRPAPPHLPATLVVGAALLILIDVTAAGRVWTRRGGVVV
jgi:hypothetical protein